jgi:hypothetical protein
MPNLTKKQIAVEVARAAKVAYAEQVALSQKASELSHSIGYADTGMVAVSIIAGDAEQKAGTKLIDEVNYLIAADYEPEYFTAPEGDAQKEQEITINSEYFDSASDSVVSIVVETTWQECYDAAKAVTFAAWLPQAAQDLCNADIKSEAFKAQDGPVKIAFMADRKAAQGLIGRYMSLQGDKLHDVKYPGRRQARIDAAKAAKEGNRKPLKRYREDVAALEKYVTSWVSTMDFFPGTMDIADAKEHLAALVIIGNDAHNAQAKINVQLREEAEEAAVAALQAAKK